MARETIASLKLKIGQLEHELEQAALKTHEANEANHTLQQRLTESEKQAQILNSQLATMKQQLELAEYELRKANAETKAEQVVSQRLEGIIQEALTGQ